MGVNGPGGAPKVAFTNTYNTFVGTSLLNYQ